MLSIDCNIRSAPLQHPWKNGIAVGRAYDLLRGDLVDHLKWLQKEIGFKTCRFHALFNDDMAVVRRRKDGSIVYQWSNIDKVYDTLLDLNLRPFVELNPMPSVLASGSQTMFLYRKNVTPPRIWQEWYDLVYAFTLHCVERYGLEEVRLWNFEVWNEPNLSAFWSGTKEDYFRLYAEAAKAVKAVDSHSKIGGPASSKTYWLEDLIQFCHEQEIPLDFISTHLYPQDEFVDYESRDSSPFKPGEFFKEKIRAARETVSASSKSHLPIHITEWNTQLATHKSTVSWAENPYVDSIHGASFIARNMAELDGVVDSLSYWVASDIFEEGPIPNSPFSHTYGLLNIHGLPKASANAFRLLKRMRGDQLSFAADKTLPFCGGVATIEGAGIHLLLWNDPPPEYTSANDWEDTIHLTLPNQQTVPQKWIVTSAQIRKGAGSSYEIWQALGQPLNLTPAQFQMLRQSSEPQAMANLVAPENNSIAQEFSIKPNEVLHLEFHPMQFKGVRKSDELPPEVALKLEENLGEKSK